jgi:hypothetical protein
MTEPANAGTNPENEGAGTPSTEPQPAAAEGSEAQPAETQGAGTPAAGSQGSDAMARYMGNLKKLSLAEKILGLVALLVFFAWVFSGSSFWSYGFFRFFFPTLSFFGALVVATLVILKVFEVRFLPSHIERLTLAIAALVPVLGLLLDSLTPIGQFLKLGGALALAYVSATAYWKKHIPEIATESSLETPPESPPETPQPPPSEEPPAS